MSSPLILVIEDDKAVTNLITATLETQDYRFRTAATGSAGIMEALASQPDLLLLDLGLPDMDGTEIIKKLRGWSTMPIIVISARTENSDKVEALDAGADDYLTKPFSVEELLARVRAALRRLRFDEENTGASPIYTNGDLTVDYAAGCAFLKGKELHLTPMEYKLLSLLAQNTGKVLTHNYILKKLWGSYLPSDTCALRVFMATLRKKIEPVPAEPRYIQTHIGTGYRMLRQPTEKELLTKEEEK